MSAIVFISTSAEVVPAIASARPGAAGDSAVEVTVIVADGLGGRTADGIRVIDVGERRRTRLRDRLEASVWGRTLVRVSPVDGGVQLRRRIRRSPDARRALDAADVVVACTRDAIYSAWSVARLQPRTLGLNGLGAGLAELRRH